MASNPPSSCCIIGVKHEGNPAGKSINFDSIDAYIAEPSDPNVHPNTAILFLPDVIGIWQNSKLMADQFASNGYTTLLIDTFNKDPLSLDKPADFDFLGWLNKGSTGNNPHTAEFVDPIVEKGLAYLKRNGFTKIGGVGYCFGGKYVTRLLASGKGLDVGYVAHPSFVTEEELANIKGPYSISAAEIDKIFTTELRHKSEEILIKTGLPYQINLFGGVSHGFAVRCDLSKKIEKFSKEKAFLQAVQWFDEHLV
ncbi:putative dienelactone hydrolase [Erysiphe necator]|uniref:Putative dienelactone hydrolase n=1 Tax=Uncinula necator TaxID=52586 RepID=A0A0B1P442_UNCNE|nr:putative dienelactone hydrolase [Erysiphe necator]